MFNFLNDLQNIRWEDENGYKQFINNSQKKQILKNIFDKKEKPTPTRILKILNLNKDLVSGWRVDKKGKPIIEELNNIITCVKYLNISNFNPWDDISALDIVDEIVEIKSKNKNWDQLINQAKQHLKTKDINLSMRKLKVFYLK